MRFRILGKYWRYLREKPQVTSSRNDGECINHPPRTIRVHPSLSGFAELETNIHEFRHAAEWDKDETWIEAVSHDEALYLWRLGYRKVEPSE